MLDFILGFVVGVLFVVGIVQRGPIGRAVTWILTPKNSDK